jgi:hypothetical protein
VSIVVDGNDQLTHNAPIREGYDSRARLELSVQDESRNQAGVERADVADRIPYLRDLGFDGDFFL